MNAPSASVTIAHLILTHKNPDQVERLIKALDHPQASFYVHVDAKADITPFQKLVSDKVKLVNNRASVHWAAWGTIQATLNGFAEILDSKVDYINVISGQDFPLQSPQKLHQFLGEHKGSEYITCERLADQWTEAQRRVKKYHFVNWNIPGKFRLSKIVSALLPERTFPYPYEIVGRSNWFTITSEAAQYILNFYHREKKYNAFFKMSWGADELYFATILYNSDFKKSIKEHLVYVDWRGQSQGHPRVLTIKDLTDIQKSDKFFARKIEMGQDEGLIEALEASL